MYLHMLLNQALLEKLAIVSVYNGLFRDTARDCTVVDQPVSHEQACAFSDGNFAIKVTSVESDA